jgi:hypothetical protein
MTIAFYEHPFSLLRAEGEDGSLREGHSVRVEDDRRLGAGGKRRRADTPTQSDCHDAIRYSALHVTIAFGRVRLATDGGAKIAR